MNESKEINDKFWMDDPNIILRQDRLTEFFITCDMNTNERLNALTRLSIYTAVILTLYYSNPKMLFLVVPFLIITWFIQKFNPKTTIEGMCNGEATSEFVSKLRTQPTVSNPFMNSNNMDFFDNPNKPRAEEYFDRTQKSLDVENKIKDAFDYNLYQDVGDTFSTQNSFRQFYTVNNGDYIPDRNGDFQKFLYGGTTSSKENTYDDFKNLSDPLQNRRSIN